MIDEKREPMTDEELEECLARKWALKPMPKVGAPAQRRLTAAEEQAFQATYDAVGQHFDPAWRVAEENVTIAWDEMNDLLQSCKDAFWDDPHGEIPRISEKLSRTYIESATVLENAMTFRAYGAFLEGERYAIRLIAGLLKRLTETAGRESATDTVATMLLRALESEDGPDKLIVALSPDK